MEQTSRSEASESSSSPFKYDVFVSSTGSEECKQFVDRLNCGLKQVCVRSFRESNGFDEELEVANLMEAIEESEIFIPIFSADYAESRRCLMEVQKAMEADGIKDGIKRVILSVFYHVEPRNVRNQLETFKIAFDKHKKNDNLERRTLNWREALRKAASLSGYDIGSSGHEKKIQEIVGKVLKELSKSRPLAVEDCLVGIDLQADEVLKLLQVGAGDVRMVVIHGMGGIGKTTLAKAVYNRIYRVFQACSFISNIREVANSTKDIVTIQDQLISDISKSYRGQVNNRSHAIDILEKVLGSNKVLVVLDDIDDGRHLQELIGMHNFCKQGSRVIVTTRDEQIVGSLKWEIKPQIFRVKELDNEQSLQLFSLHAFRKDYMDLDHRHAEFSKKIMDTVGGLPSAIKEMGSNIYGIGDDIEWDEILGCPGIHLRDVFQSLKRSFADLSMPEKAVFLDIGCFFNGIDKETALFVWNACGLFALTSVKGLCKKSLLRITDDGILEMHAVLREMGRTIILENESDPCRRSRLWVHKEIMNVLKQQKGTHRVEGISLIMERQMKDQQGYDFSGDISASVYNHSDLQVDDGNGKNHNEDECSIRIVCTDGFASMYRLRVLTLKHVYLTGSYDKMPKKLKWLQWHGCPLESIPDGFSIMEVSALDLSYSNITQLRSMTGQPKCKVFYNLKVLNLTACNRLASTPNFSAFPNLVKLILDCCEELIVIDGSIECLKVLVLLSMKRCIKLKELPNAISHLTSLERLNLAGCEALENLPESINKLKSQKTLDTSDCVHLRTAEGSFCS